MKHVHPEKEKTALVVRLRKIRGQVEAVERMVTEDADCAEILNQVISARNALKSVAEKIIHSHAHDCIEHVEDAAQGRRNLRSLITVLERYVS
jgi:DNA-binding FrmR family transcriptional regulator